MVHIGKGTETLHAKLCQSIATFLRDVEIARCEVVHVKLRQCKEHLVVVERIGGIRHEEDEGHVAVVGELRALPSCCCFHLGIVEASIPQISGTEGFSDGAPLLQSTSYHTCQFCYVRFGVVFCQVGELALERVARCLLQTCQTVEQDELGAVGTRGEVLRRLMKKARHLGFVAC